MITKDNTKLYHGTFVCNLAGIKRDGLKPGCRKNWPNSNPEHVYFAKYPDCAFKFCKNAPEKCIGNYRYNSGIVVLEVLKSDLMELISERRSGQIAIDRTSKEADSLTFNGTVPAEILKIVTNYGKWCTLKSARIYPRYYAEPVKRPPKSRQGI